MKWGGPSIWVLGAVCLVAASGAQVPRQKPDDVQTGSYHLQINVNRALIPVVVRDKQGRTVGDLNKEDFTVLDEGKPRAISGFMVERRRVLSHVAEGSAAPAPPVKTAPDGTVLPSRITVFLFDDMHLSAEDLAQVRAAGMKVISGAMTGTDMAAVVSMSGHVNTGLTRDKAKLEEGLNKLVPEGIFHSDAMECPSIDYYEADLIENKHDPVAVQDANQKYTNCNPALTSAADLGSGSNLPNAERMVDAAAQRALNVGHQDIQTTYAGIAAFVQRMGQLPGQRTLILVSPGFLNIERDALARESGIIDMAIKADVTISALDARGLYTTEMTASQHSPALGGRSLQVNADMQRSSMKLAENAMAELSDGTGGRFFHNSNDLALGLQELSEAPDCLYLLEFSLQGVKQNGAYHQLTVKVDRPGIEVEARRGYFVPKSDKH